MYCPKCSQQQISEEMRFCSRCGFPLEGVKELVVAGGVLEKPDTAALDQQSQFVCSVRKSVALMVGAFPMLIVVGILSAINDGFAVLALLPLFCFVFGFIRLIYITSKAVKRRKNDAAAIAGQQTTLNVQLPPPRVAPIDNFTQRINTAEMVRPPSVTENTTKLLDEEHASQR